MLPGAELLETVLVDTLGIQRVNSGQEEDRQEHFLTIQRLAAAASSCAQPRPTQPT